MSEAKKKNTIEAIEAYEEYITASRVSFDKMMIEDQHIGMDSILHSLDELNMRLEYYKEIKKFRKELRKKSKNPELNVKNQQFDITMKVKYPNEIK